MNLMKTNLTIFLMMICGLLQTPLSEAHGRYILPSHTQLSGEDAQQVTLTASITNDIFHPDKPLGNNAGGKVNPFLEGIFKQIEASVTLPDGSVSHDIKWRAFARQSVADFTINQSGTYRFSLLQKPTSMLTFKLADGTSSRIFGQSKKLPKGATDIVRHSITSRVETFVTHNEPNNVAIKSTGVGIELGGESHPNDLFVGEEASFQILLNGNPVADSTKVKITFEGTRHRNQRGSLDIETNKAGNFKVNFKQAGFYLLEVDQSSKGTNDSSVDFYHSSLYLTFEVFPE